MQQFMQRAINLAKRGIYSTKPNPNVGCVLVKNDKIIGEGWHKQAGMPHAEIEAMHNAKTSIEGATAFVTLEPCSHYGRTPPCALALIKAGIKKVVIGMQDPNPKVSGAGIKLLRQAGIEVEVGVLREQVEALNTGFIHKMYYSKPLVVGKLGMSVDGKIALKNGLSKWITSPASRLKVQQLRAKADCVVTGIGSILADDSRLNVRIDELRTYLAQNYADADIDFFLDNLVQPARVVLDSNLQLPLTAKVIGEDAKCIILASQIYATSNARAFDTKKRQLEELSCKIFTLPVESNGLNLDAVLDLLNQLDFNSLFVEAGAKLSGAFAYKNLYDILYLFQAPIILGSEAQSAFNMPSLETLETKKPYNISKIARYNGDICLKLSKNLN